MDVLSEVGYTSATTGREDHEVYKGNVVALAQKIMKSCRTDIWHKFHNILVSMLRITHSPAEIKMEASGLIYSYLRL
jgi:hypothetical protein